MKIIYLILFSLLILYLYKNKETFLGTENSEKYIPINNKFCLVSKKITDNGGTYSSEIVKDFIKTDNNQKLIPIDEEFTEEICTKKNFGSGRQRGGFECMDFITKKLAKKYNLEYSDKTCYDSLEYIPDYPNYNSQVQS